MSDIQEQPAAEPGSTEPVQAAETKVEDPNAGASSAAALSTSATSSFAPAASPDAAKSPSVESSAEPLTFEQRVEQRFLALEHSLMGMPASIAAVNGHESPLEWGKSVLAHLFGKHE